MLLSTILCRPNYPLALGDLESYARSSGRSGRRAIHGIAAGTSGAEVPGPQRVR